jgi:hypothetical protein
VETVSRARYSIAARIAVEIDHRPVPSDANHRDSVLVRHTRSAEREVDLASHWQFQLSPSAP